MTRAEERISTLETRVGQLETWAGPGQIEAILAGMRGIRADITVIRRVQDRHSAQLAGLKTDFAELKTDFGKLKTDFAELKTDVAGLKGDVAELKSGMAEVLRRLPEPPAYS